RHVPAERGDHVPCRGSLPADSRSRRGQEDGHAMGILPDEIKTAMQGVIPSHVVTCSKDGIPNASVISQVYYVDADRVALSHQFFNKTAKNVRENPYAAIWITHPETFETWDLELAYDHSETEGPIFDEMD